MITINNLTFSHGITTIFNEANTVFEDGKTALVGRNGSGKTTLFNMIAGEMRDFQGDIIKTGSSRIGYLKQEMKIEESILMPVEFLLNNIDYYYKYNDLMKKIENMNKPDFATLNRLSLYEEEYRHMEGYSLNERAYRMLSALGFAEHMNKSVHALSYGFKMRLMLAKILLEDNNMLLLDEPTNHLDLPSIKWLEAFLQSTNKSAVIVSHDRAFLDAICMKTVELSGTKLISYKGNYTFYKEEKKKFTEKMEMELKNLKEEERQLIAFINKWKAKNTKVAMAHSREKVLSKVRDKMKGIQIIYEKDVKFSYHNVEILRSRKGIKGNIIEKAYNKKQILSNLSLDIAPQKKIFLIGKNGIGKSTLVRILAQNDDEYAGNLEYNDGLNMLFFDFDRISQLPSDDTVLSFIQHLEPNEFRAKSLLGMMLFNADDYDKPVGVLSGGEKVRLYMCRLFISKFNFVVLDEPTNYLDIDTIDIFIKWLEGLKCGFIIVSHNEYLLRAVHADEMWAIENGKLNIHYGDYNDLIASGEYRDNYEQKENRISITSEPNNPVRARKENRQDLINKRISVNREIGNTEKQISAYEIEREEIFNMLKDVSLYRKDPQKVKLLRQREKEIGGKLDCLYEKWNQLVEEKPELD